MKAAIFDVDGTLVDSVDFHAQAWQDAFAHYGYRIPFDQLRAQIGKGGDQLMPIFLSKQEVKTVGRQIEKFRGEHFKKEFLHRVTGFAEVRPLFQRLLADGWRIALASSAKADELGTYKKISKIDDLVETETSTDDAAKSKPHPDIFQAAIERLGQVAPRDCVVIGDSPYDAEAAGKAGIRSVAFLSGGFPAEQLQQAGYEAVYQDAGDLLGSYEQSVFRRERPERTG